MPFWERSRAGGDARPRELAQLLVDCRDAFIATDDRFHWEPAVGSVAERAATALPSPDPLVTDAVGESGHRLVVDVVQTYLVTASGHVGGLAALYNSGEVLFPPALLVRAAIENCAQAMWILGDNPSEPSDLRLARAYLQNLLVADEAIAAMGRLSGKTGALQDAAAQHAALTREILARFPGTPTQDLAGYQLRGQQLLEPEHCVAWMYALLAADAGSTVDERASLEAYGFLSHMTRPTLYPARQLQDSQAEDRAEHARGDLRVDVDFLERQASAAVIVFYHALSRVTSYNEWEPSILDALQERIDKTLHAARR